MNIYKPSGLKITDMCKYVDDTIYKGNLSAEEVETIHVYLYWISFALTSAQKLLTYKDELESFSLYLTEQVYERLTNPKQFTNPPKIEKIKSCLNYIKKILHGRLLNWKESFKFSEVLDSYTSEDSIYKNYIDTTLYIEELKSNLESTYRPELIREIIDEIRTLPKLIFKVCAQTRFFYDKTILNNLYISCLLSFLNSITLNNRANKLIEERKKKKTYTEYFRITLQQKEINEDIILWHLSDEYKSIVKVLMNRIRIEFIESISKIQDSFKIPDFVTGSIFCIERRDRNPHVQ